MNQSTPAHPTHDTAEHSPQQTVAGAVLTAALAPLAVAAVAAPVLTASAALVVLAALLAPSVVRTLSERVYTGSNDGDCPASGQAAASTSGSC
jgi:hypothetical protein